MNLEQPLQMNLNVALNSFKPTETRRCVTLSAMKLPIKFKTIQQRSCRSFIAARKGCYTICTNSRPITTSKFKVQVMATSRAWIGCNKRAEWIPCERLGYSGRGLFFLRFCYQIKYEGIVLKTKALSKDVYGHIDLVSSPTFWIWVFLMERSDPFFCLCNQNRFLYTCKTS